MKKESKKLFKALEQAGYEVRPTRNQHVRITHPEKPGIVHAASTPSDNRSLKNLKAQLRRTFGWEG